MKRTEKGPPLKDIFLTRWHPCAWILAAVILVYFRTLFFGFTYLDDKELIIDNYGFISDISNIPQAFMSRVFPKVLVPYYRPILTVTFMLNSKFGGVDPLSYHLVNIMIHSAVCIMVFFVLKRLWQRPLQAFLMALFFAVHPALVQAVAWIPGRNDSLLSLFALASFISFMDYAWRKRRRSFILHLAFFALALFTKETAIALIPVCFIYWKLMEKESLSLKDMKYFFLGWIAITDLWFIVRQIALEGSFDSTLYGISSALFVSSPAVIQYIGKILMPFNLSVFPTIKDTTFVYGALAAAVISFALWRSRDKRAAFIIFGLSWFMLFLAPSLVRISVGLVHDFQEHRMYLPMIGMLILFGEIDLIKNMDIKRGALAPALVLLAVFAAINFRHADNFKDRMAYWENAVMTAPGSWLTHLKVAYMYYDAGLLDKAEAEYRRAIELDRIQPAAYAGLGHVYLSRNALGEAEKEFRRAIAACNANYPSYVSLGTVYYRQGRLKEAADMWVEALRLYPDSIDALRNLAIFCAEQKDFDSARFYVERLRRLGVEPPGAFIDTIGY